MKKTSKLLVSVTPRMKTNLKTVSERYGLSISDVVRRGIITELRTIEGGVGR